MEISIFWIMKELETFDTTLLFLSKHLLLLPLLIISILFVLKWLNHYSNSSKNLPPSPPKLPIIGNLHQLGAIPRRSLKSMAEKYDPVMLLQLGSKPTLVISSADAVEEIFKKKDLVFANRMKPRFVGKLLYNFRDMAFSPYGPYWRHVRGVCVSQLLSNTRVRSFRNVREEEISRMLENVRESCLSGLAVPMSEVLATFTNNTVSTVAIGKRYSEEKNGSQFKALFLECTTIGGHVNVADFLPWLGWINHFNGLEAKVSKLQKEVDQYLETIVEEGIKRQEKIVSIYGGNEGGKEQQNFLDVLLELKGEDENGFTLQRDSMKAVILNMVLGGTDTTSSLLEWAFSELLRNPNTMIKLQKEVREFNISKSDQMIITEDDLGKLPYLKAVIKEALRMHPPVGLLSRASRESVKILGYDIAAKTQVLINAWAIGRDPRSWEEADEFRPERFLNSPVDIKGHHFEYLPFGSGRRICPGYGFALVSAELALANLIRNFNFALADGGRPEELDMTEAPGVVTPRQIPLLLVASLP